MPILRKMWNQTAGDVKEIHRVKRTKTSRRSMSTILILVGILAVALSPTLFLWIVPVQKPSFRDTGRGDSVTIKRDTQVDIPLNANQFAVDYGKGERLALQITASGSLSILVVGSPATEWLTYPPRGIGINCESGTCTMVESTEPNVPETIVLDVSDYTRLSFVNKPSDSDVRASYEFLVAYNEVTITYPYRDSNVYLIAALVGILVLASGIVLRAGMGVKLREPIQPRESVSVSVFCTHCGGRNPAGYQYCGKCGARLQVE